jgi:TRAP-type C4-dicarboxylate transport system substrate-binding protein
MTVINGVRTMLFNRKVVRRCALASLALVSAAAMSAASAQTVLRFNRWLPPNHNVQGGVMVEWAKQVAAVTDGRVRIEFTPSSLGPPPRQFDLAAQGVADVVLGVHGYTPARFRLTQIVEMPFLGDSGERISAAYWDVHHKYLEKGNEHDGVKLLALWAHGPGIATNRVRPLVKVADFNGLKLRVAGGLMTDIAKTLGAVPIQAPVPQLYEILSRGVADGVLFTAEGITEFNLQKIMRHVTKVPGGLFNTSFFLAVNPRAWSGLSPADQAAIEKLSGKGLSAASGRSYDRLDAVADGELKSAGIQIATADAAFVDELRRRLAPLETQWIADAKSKGVDGAEALKMLRSESARQ